MRGRFRRDAALVQAPRAPGALLLVRDSRSRTVWRVVTAASLVPALVDLRLERPLLTLAQLVLFGVFLVVNLVGGAWSWRIAGDEIVVRWLSFEHMRPRVKIDRLHTNDVRRIGIARSGYWAQAWLELQGGEEYALCEGHITAVEAIAQNVQQTVLLARAAPSSTTIH